MREITKARVDEIMDFARRARARFLKEPGCNTYTDGEIEPGALFGIRWGMEPAKAHAVLVLRIDGDGEYLPAAVGDLDREGP